MDSLFYIVVILLVILKLLIWACVFYSRAQRARMARCQRGILIIQDCRRGILIPADSESAINQTGLENPHVSAMMPPSYEEVLRTKTDEVKPPAYDQVLHSGNTYQVPHTTDQGINMELPPSYTPTAQDYSVTQQQQPQGQQHQQQYQQQISSGTPTHPAPSYSHPQDS